MKKAVSIFLIFIFLFNVIGYYGICAGLLLKANHRANQQIEDNNYDHAQTITVKIPLTLPYPVQNEFEHVSGDFEHKGEFYKLVEQKYENDTVYVVCLKNNEKKKALAVLNDVVKQSANQSSSNQDAKTLATILKDYNPVTEEFVIQPLQSLDASKYIPVVTNNILSQILPVPTPPPNKIC